MLKLNNNVWITLFGQNVLSLCGKSIQIPYRGVIKEYCLLLINFFAFNCGKCLKLICKIFASVIIIMKNKIISMLSFVTKKTKYNF